MSEKRFVLIEDDLEPLILDNKETMSVNEVVDLLNEQQATIERLKKENKQLKDKVTQLENRLNYWIKLYNELYIKIQNNIPPKVREVWLE